MKIVIKGKLPGLNEYIEAERRNRYKGAQMKREAEAVVGWAVRSARLKTFTKPVVMRYRWFEPNRKRDKDNISSYGRKVIQDALVKMGVLKGDGWKYISGFSDEFFVDKLEPRIEVVIEEVEDGDL